MDSIEWMLVMEARLEDKRWEILNNQLIKAETMRIRIRIRNAVFVGRLLRAFTKPGANRPTKYKAFPKRFNNQLAREDRKE